MNIEEIEKLKSKIIEFENKDVYIELQNSIQYHFTIHNTKVFISNERLIISDGKQDFIIELHYLDSVKIEDFTIYINLDFDVKIVLDY